MFAAMLRAVAREAEDREAAERAAALRQQPVPEGPHGMLPITGIAVSHVLVTVRDCRRPAITNVPQGCTSRRSYEQRCQRRQYDQRSPRWQYEPQCQRRQFQQSCQHRQYEHHI